MTSGKQVICHDINGKLYKVDAKKLIFRPSIYGILIEKNKVLLSKQWAGYDFPGGGAKLHETIDDTLEREFWEETGFKVRPDKIIYVGSSFFYALSRKKYWNCQLFYFLVKKISGQLSKANFDEYSGITLNSLDLSLRGALATKQSPVKFRVREIASLPSVARNDKSKINEFKIRPLYEKKYADLAEWIDIKKLGRIKFYNNLGNQGSLKIIKEALKS